MVWWRLTEASGCMDIDIFSALCEMLLEVRLFCLLTMLCKSRLLHLSHYQPNNGCSQFCRLVYWLKSSWQKISPTVASFTSLRYCDFFPSFFPKKYFFLYYLFVPDLVCSMRDLSVAVHGISSCHMWNLVPSPKDRTRAPNIGSAES